MAWVKEFSASTSSSNSVSLTVPAGGVAAGHFLALGLGYTGATPVPTWTVTDTRSNSWTVDPTYGNKSFTVTGSFNGVTLATCVVGTALQAGDTVTATSSTGTVTRLAAEAEEFDDVITAIDIGSTNDNGAVSSGSPTSGNFTTTQANELLIGALGMVSAGRIYTPSAGWTAGTKIATVVGSGDRAVVVQWQSVSSTGTYAASGTFNSSALYTFAAAGYKISAGGGGSPRPGTGNPKVWDGSAWVAHPSKVWDGSAWVIHPARGWDGTNWVDSK